MQFTFRGSSAERALPWVRVPELHEEGVSDRFILEDGGGRSRRTSTDPSGRVVNDELTRHLRSVLVRVPRVHRVRSVTDLLGALDSAFVCAIATPDTEFSMLPKLDLAGHHRWDVAESVEVRDRPGTSLPVVVSFFRPTDSTATEIDWVDADLYAQLPFGNL